MFESFLLETRRILAKRANLCVLPNESRIERFKQDTGTARRVFQVWNCPSLQEAVGKTAFDRFDNFVVFFHGSIVPARLPLTLVEALAKLPDQVVLRVAGYETVGYSGYLQALKNHANKFHVGDRFTFLGAIPSRRSLLDQCRNADVGIAFMPLQPANVNEQTMTGASNKPFDYLACGLALLVSDRADWKEIFVEPGYGLACDPSDSESIARQLRWFFEHRAETRLMGSSGRQQILREWNYERQFSRVLHNMEMAAQR